MNEIMMLDPGCWILDPGCWIPDPGFWVLVQGSRFEIPGSRFNVDEIVKSPRSVMPDPGSSPGQAFLIRHPEVFEITGFPLSRE
ncbi:MAG: hypothetical protein K9L59_17170 [Desulfobacterales bacterium]|nr:hypothetical protein [Desulfobacterales bacterium]